MVRCRCQILNMINLAKLPIVAIAFLLSTLSVYSIEYTNAMTNAGPKNVMATSSNTLYNFPYLKGNFSGSFTNTNATASTVSVYDANKRAVSSVVTSTELFYLSGTTSNVQSQLNTLRSNVTAGGQPASLNLTNWSGISTSAYVATWSKNASNAITATNALSGWPTQWSAASITNLGTMAYSNAAAFQPATANLSNWSAITTFSKQNALGYTPQNGSANLTNWSLISTSALANAGQTSFPLSSITNANHLTNWSLINTSILSSLSGTNSGTGQTNWPLSAITNAGTAAQYDASAFVSTNNGTAHGLTNFGSLSKLGTNSGGIYLEKDGDAGLTGAFNMSGWNSGPGAIELPRFRLHRPTPDMNGVEDFYIAPYQWGMGIGYAGTLELWVQDLSVMNKGDGTRGGHLWVDDHDDCGGMLTVGYHVGDEIYAEMSAEKFNGKSHGELKLRIVDSTNGISFLMGERGTTNIVGLARITGDGRMSIGSTNVSQILDIHGGTNSYTLQKISSSDGPGIIYYGYAGNTVSDPYLRNTALTDSYGIPYIISVDGVPIMRFYTNGTVGIKTSTSDPLNSFVVNNTNTTAAAVRVDSVAPTAANGGGLVINAPSDGNHLIYEVGGVQQFIESIVGTDYRLYANGDYRLAIKSTGEVGIGTIAPSTKLDVAGDITATNLYAKGTIYGTATNADTVDSVHINALTAGKILYAVDATHLGDSGIAYTNGRVGIGIANPLSEIQIGSVASGSGESTYHGQIMLQAANGPNGEGGLEFKTVSVGNGYGFKIYGSSSTDDLGFAYRTDSSSWSHAMSIKNTGKLGISTTAPDRRLEVNDTANQLRLTYNDADGSAASYADFSVNSAGNLSIAPSGGKLGLGTGSPIHVLDVNNYIAANTLEYGIRIKNNYVHDETISGIGFSISGADAIKGGIIFRGLSEGWYRGDIQFLQNNSGNLASATLSDVAMTIKSTGNVGIGVTNPATKFDVAGDTTTTNLIVKSQIIFTNGIWDDVMIPGLTVKAGSTAPILVNMVDSTLQVYGFAGSATDDTVYFSAQFPHGIKIGSSVYPHIHWTRTADPGAADRTNVVWELSYSFANIGETFPSVTTVNITNSVSATNYTHQLSAFPAIVKANTGISSMINCRLRRLAAANASDTYDHPAAFLQFDFHYMMDTLGSLQETSK